MISNSTYKLLKRQPGFSLAELLAALTIAAMVLAAVLGVYSRTQRSAAAIIRKLDSSRLPSEVLQRIAEDLDRIATPGSGTKVTVENKIEEGFPTARLTILRTIYDKTNKKQTFEKIIWQTSLDYDTDAGGLVLYRSHSGINVEDKLLDEQKEDWERQLFIPVCTGVTFFKIQIPSGETFRDSWTRDSLPAGIAVTISFAAPFKKLDGTLDVPEAEKITRTIAVDRTRKINFILPPKETEDEEDIEEQDTEELTADGDANDLEEEKDDSKEKPDEQ